MPPKHQRKSHTKSKAGCSQCKQRRIKCNERRPTCSHCERRQIVCDFSLSPADSGLGRSNSQGSANTPIANTQSNGTNHGSPSSQRIRDPFSSPNLISTKQTTDLDVSDLELMYHYTSVTGPNLGDNKNGPSHCDLWQNQFPRLAFKHDFLLRGILALSALHLSYLDPNRRSEFDWKASAHQDIALAAFQETLPFVNETNCHALFAFSCLLIAIAFATSSRDAANGEVDIDALHWVWLLRGGNSILQMHKETLRSSFLAPMLDVLMFNEMAETHEIPNADRITSLFKLTHDIEDSEAAQACTLAVHHLLSTFIQASVLRKRRQGSVLTSLVWPVHLSPKFMELLNERKPEAMVILAHYCVLIHWGAQDDTWFLIGWARHMLEAIKMSVGESWNPMLAWPDSIIR